MPSLFQHGYALLVGVGQCSHAPWSLPATASDAQAIRRILTDRNLCAYPDDKRHVRLLSDEEASSVAILGGLAWLKKQAKDDPDATIMVYYSGHGWVETGTGAYYLITHDAEESDVPGTVLSAEVFSDALRDIPAKRLLVIIDACHAEGMATSKAPSAAEAGLPQGFAKSPPPPSVLKALKQGEGRAVFSSSRGAELSYLRKDGALSLYTHHLIEAFHGAGNRPGDTVVRLSNLMNHVGRAVPASARRERQAQQTPFFDLASEDFAVAVLRGGKGLPAGGWSAVQAESEQTLRSLVQALGKRSVAVGGEVTDSAIVTGDYNTIQQGKYNIHIGKARGLAIGDHARAELDAADADEDADVDDD